MHPKHCFLCGYAFMITLFSLDYELNKCSFSNVDLHLGQKVYIVKCNNNKKNRIDYIIFFIHIKN